jgi:Ca2+-binding RTX toxin-like protein
VVVTFLIGCVVLLVGGCAGVRSQAPQKEELGHTEATASEEARCEGKRSIMMGDFRPTSIGNRMTTNDIPGCPYGGLLLGTDKEDVMNGKKGEDEINGLGARDYIAGGFGSDVLYGGDGNDTLQGSTILDAPDESTKDVLHGGPGKDLLEDYDGGDDVLYGDDGDDKLLMGGAGEDVIYGGDGNDHIDGATVDIARFNVRKQRDELYCGEGEDHYNADKLDYVDSSCEVKQPLANR